MKCRICGEENEGKFCQKCGAPMEVAAPSAPVEQKQEDTFKEKTQANINNLEKKMNSISNNKLICAMGMLPGFFWIPLVANRKNKEYAECASNGLMLKLLTFVIGVVFGVVFDVIDFMPLETQMSLSGLTSALAWISSLLYFAIDILSYFGFVSVFLGKDFRYPIIGKKNIFEKLD